MIEYNYGKIYENMPCYCRAFYLFLFLCCGKNGGNIRIIDNIETCQKVKMEIKQAVCGRCILKCEGEKLYIIPTQECPPYEVYKCKTKDGKSFSINNFRCEPQG
ncbi:MAG: hypothetical protein ACK4Y7_00360 [Caldimicrobium sp.]